jgi:hypothetical protein
MTGSFMRADETQQINEILNQTKDQQQIDFINGLENALIQSRREIYKSDLSRAILLAFVALGIIFVTVYSKLSHVVVMLIAGITVFGDNWSVAKRYLNNEDESGSYASYEDEEKAALPYLPQTSDSYILEQEKGGVSNFDSEVSKLMDAMPDAPNYEAIENGSSQRMLAEFGALNLNSNYRVFTFGNPFNETATSYFHKSLGGYHGAKLKRYQEMIDFHIMEAMNQVNAEISAEKNVKLREYSLFHLISPRAC